MGRPASAQIGKTKSVQLKYSLAKCSGKMFICYPFPLFVKKTMYSNIYSSFIEGAYICAGGLERQAISAKFFIFFTWKSIPGQHFTVRVGMNIAKSFFMIDLNLIKTFNPEGGMLKNA